VKGNILKQNKGFTFVESLVALLIFSIVMIGFNALLTTVIKNNFLNKKITTATALVRNKIEDLKSKGYTSSDLSSGSHSDSNNPINEIGTNGGIFTRNWTVAEASSMKNVTVTVSWDSGKHNVSLTAKVIQ